MIKFKFQGKYITACIPAGNQKADLKTIFPDPVKNSIEELRDKYGNYQWVLVDGEAVLKPQKPTAEQLGAYRKKRIIEEIEKRYSKDDEIALMMRGTAEEKAEHEKYVYFVKEKIDTEIKDNK